MMFGVGTVANPPSISFGASLIAALRHSAGGILLALTLCALVVIPSAAAAKGLSIPLNHVAEFTLHSSNGYQITVTGSIAGPSGKSTVRLEAVHEDRFAQGSSRVEYTAPGRVTSKGLKVSFGRLGAASVRFKPSGKVERLNPPKRCGGPSEAKLGTFVGGIRFKGEQGYTKVDSDRASGGVGNRLAIGLARIRHIAHIGHGKVTFLCATSNSGERQEPQEPTLTVENIGEGVAFLAIATPVRPPRQPGQSLFNADVSEKRGRLSVNRSVSANGPVSDFIFNNALATASVTPPAPFVGSASFQRYADGSTTWAGSLSASFPGRGIVKLAGPSFTAHLEGPSG